MGLFITFEGIEGCGKSTQVRLLADLLQSRGKHVVMTREPGGCPISDGIRAILLDAANRAMIPLAELLLYAAARAQHVAQVILPALESGAIVLCDRFTDATIAYQGYGRNLDQETITLLNDLACLGVRPHLTLLIDCPVETGLNRAKARIEGATGPREERMELESLAFHRKVRDGYRSLAAAEPERFVIIDGSSSVAEVSAAVSRTVNSLIEGGRHAVC